MPERAFRYGIEHEYRGHHYAARACKLVLPIDRSFRLDEAAAAQAHIRANAHFGKVVLTM